MLDEMGKLAVVTGASSGIGAAFATALAGRGYDLILVARREGRLKELAASLQRSRDTKAEVLPADLASEEGISRLEERIAAASNLELLVNNAGFGTFGYFYSIDPASQESMHRLHVIATMRLTRAALNAMVPRKSGAVINVSSVAGFWQAPLSVSYCATKCWMNSFTRGLALELRAIGSPVKMQALCPGFTVSEFHDVARIDRNTISKSWWMTAEKVVSDSLDGLDQGRVFVIPGWRYRVGVFFMSHVPRAILDRIAVRTRPKIAER